MKPRLTGWKRYQDRKRTLWSGARQKFTAVELEKTITGLTVTEREEVIQAKEKEAITGKKLEASSRLEQVELELKQIEEEIKSKEDSLKALKDREQDEEKNIIS